MPNSKPYAVENITPVLRVRNLAAGIAFYRDVLGFKTDWETPTVAGLSRDGKGLMLTTDPKGQAATWVWMGVDNVEKVHALCQQHNVKVLQPPTNRPWAYEMQLEDLDGHVLWVGSEPKQA